jgi:nucleotide-binding universal stress UspA family protein
MNTIVVPTDFSEAAQHATAYAAQLATQLDAPVLLLHVYQMPVPMTEYPVLMVTHDDIKKGVTEGLQKAKEEAQASHAGVTFETESRLGDVATEIEEVCNDRNPFAVVVGTKDLSGFERFLFGNTTVSLIRNATYPVIALPEGAGAGTPKNIVLATDLLAIDEMPTAKIAAMVKQLRAALHVVHVDTKNNDEAAPESLLQRLADVNPSFHSVQEDDVTEGIRLYVENNNIDLVLVVPHQHNFYERLFFKGHTQGILQAVPVPVMSLRNE